MRPAVSNHFPPSVRDMLVEAASHPHSLYRIEAIDDAIEHARTVYPELFRPDAGAHRSGDRPKFADWEKS